MPGSRNRGEAEKAKNFPRAIKRMIKELKPFYVPTIVATLFATIGSIIAIITPNKLSDLTDEIAAGLTRPMDTEAVWGIAIIVGVLFIVSLIFEIIEGFLMTDVSNNFARLLRNRISEKINRLPLRFFDRNQTGDTLSRVTNDRNHPSCRCSYYDVCHKWHHGNHFDCFRSNRLCLCFLCFDSFTKILYCSPA